MEANVDKATVEGFGDEWRRFDQTELSEKERRQTFDRYFSVFPWDQLSPSAVGLDLGCGSGRWAIEVAQRVGLLQCVDASSEALDIARNNLSVFDNVRFCQASAGALPFEANTFDFGYSLGVLHHTPSPEEGLQECSRVLKPGAPFLVYLYYRFDHRPLWFRAAWRASDLVRRVVSRTPSDLRQVITDGIAAGIYWPAASIARVADKLGLDPSPLPLSFYRNTSLYTMRTDARDRFGTRLEHRFRRDEIDAMLRRAGFEDVQFSDTEPFWCAVSRRAP